MAKIRVTLEMEIDEHELAEMTSSQNEYEPLTVQEYFDGMKFKRKSGRVIFANEIEEYYNDNEGDSNCIKDVIVTSIYLIGE